jgi:hypothetical protein
MGSITARAPTRVWHARDSKLYFALSSGVTLTATTNSLNGLFEAGTGARVEALAKNITIVAPETGFDKIDLLGVDTSSFQNALLDQKPLGLPSISGTLILDEDETLSPYLDGTSTSISGAYSRYQLGNAQQPEIAILATLTVTAAEMVNFAFDKAYITKWGDIRISGPDGHWEQDFSAVCLPKNFYWEFKD